MLISAEQINHLLTLYDTFLSFSGRNWLDAVKWLAGNGLAKKSGKLFRSTSA
jgi:hypothetical protein